MKKMFFAIFMIVTSLAIIAQPSLDDLDNDTRGLYNEGIQLKNSGDFLSAVKKFEAVNKKTNNYLVHYQIGECYQKYSKTASSSERDNYIRQAIESFNKCFETYPSYDLAYFKIAAAHYGLGEYDKAIEFFEKTKESTKNKKYVKVADKNIDKAKEKLAYPFLLTANEELSRKNFNQAIQSFNKVLEYTTSDVAYLGLADAYSEMGEWQKSLEAAENANTYRKSIPKGGPSYYMGHAFNKLGDAQKAVNHYKECISDKSSKNTYKARAAHELEQLEKKN
ncbi:MAG: tetratricopeptide repeat protein [Melioribacteraceae bacterium]|nr:tetratricopeptide repeat protein [Melioribacteraceae bacterium]MCF8265018.1 tetratricopeptide repeat protein [Melioribacteraceae bacterium]MCF8413819.1 tetratricopeptide repeat protein [Melioribacteraceae bacterium]